MKLTHKDHWEYVKKIWEKNKILEDFEGVFQKEYGASFGVNVTRNKLMLYIKGSIILACGQHFLGPLGP